MLLGFPYLAVVVLVIFSVIRLVVRRKWRLAEARREEIKRLLVLASEEAARAELEAVTGDVSAPPIKQQLQYQCALCFAHTTKLCARCKAVRYCSGKCQIIHWRQGHKEECVPFITIHKINDVDGGSSQKAFKQEEYKNGDNDFETEGRQFAKPVETFREEQAFCNSSHSKVQHKEDDIEVDCLEDGESSIDASVCNSTDSDRSDGLQSTNASPDKFETNATTNQNRPQFSEHSTLVDSVDSFTSSVKFEFTKLSCSDGDAQRVSSSSSGWSIDGSKESSMSEPSTPSSDFWEGAINSRKSRTDALDDSFESSSIDTVDGNMSRSRSSLTFSSELLKKTLPPMDLRGSYVKTVKLDEAVPATSGFKRPIDKDASSEELSIDGLKSRDRSYSSSSTSCAHPASSAGGYSISTDAKRVNSLLPLNSQKSNHVVNDMRNSSHALKSCEVGSVSSKASDAHLPSISGRHSAQIPKSINDDVYSQNAKNGLKTSMWKVVDQLKASKLSRHYPLGAGIEIAGKYNYKGLFSYELFIKLYNWKEVELRPCGLINCGNSCYANAVLQCLAFTPPLTAYFLQGLHSKECKKKEWCFTCEFESLVLKAKGGNSPLSPIRILSHIQNIGSHLSNGREEDAHEFLRYAVDTMQSICLKEAGANPSGTLEEETTLMGLTFGGYLRSKIRCMKCGGKSERHERMMDLTVEIEGDIGTLEEALRQFTGTEILDGENKYQCSRCKSYEKAKKKLTLLEAPNVLTIALKRFQSGKFGKINKSIRFPELLDLAPYMSGMSYKSTVYRLYGLVVHLDIMNAAFSGHYVCYVRNSQNKWFKIDDSTVKPVELERVLAKGAYMLLYARCSPRAPRSIRNSMIPLDPRKPKNQTSKLRSDSANGRASTGRLHPDHSNYQPIFEEDSSSDNSSSFFSEAGSCSTESSNRDSSSTEDYLDQIFGDVGRNWNSPWRNSSDSSDTSSSSSPLPLYSSGSNKGERSESKPFLYSDITKHTSRKLVSSSSNSSCRETDSDRLGRLNPIDKVKTSVSYRRSTRGRAD